MVWSEEYSEQFDELRKNRVKTSFYKYGPIKTNATEKLFDTMETCQMCIEKYKSTGNTEYLCDAANYLMFEFMYPQLAGAFFKATSSSESAGRAGTSVKQIEENYRY